MSQPFHTRLTLRIVRQLLGHATYTQDAKPIALTWVGDNTRSVLINLDSTRTFASLWQDPCEKFHPTIYALLAGTLRICRHEGYRLFGIRSFPLFTTLAFRYECPTMSNAQKRLQEYLAEMRII
jgi:hypothetical protein